MNTQNNTDDAKELEFGWDDNLNEVIELLGEGDSVILADRTYPMEVFEKTREKIGSDKYKTTIVYLNFRNRTYRLRGQNHHPGEDTVPPRLEIKKEPGWKTVRSSIDQIKIETDQQIISDTRAKDWLAEAGIDIQ